MVQKAGTTSEKRRNVERKIEELEAFLRGPGEQSVGASLSQIEQSLESSLSQTLFDRAPISFLERKTLSDLASITAACSECLQHFVSGKQQFEVRVIARADFTQLFVAIGDRPFVLNTVMSRVKQYDVDLSAILYPLLQFRNGQRVALLYAELPALAGEQHALLSKDLEQDLLDNIQVTDDFTAMLVRTQTAARQLEESHGSTFPITDRKEVGQFLKWLADGAIIFLGHCQWDVKPSDRGSELLELVENPSAPLGLFSSSSPYVPALLSQTRADAHRLLDGIELLSVERLTIDSPVQRRENFLNVSFREFGTDGRFIAIHSLVGIFTAKAADQDVLSVPYLDRKVANLLELEEVIPNSHSYKNILNILNGMPKEELFGATLSELQEDLALINFVQTRSETKTSVRPDGAGRGLLIRVVMPHENFREQIREKVQEHVESVLGLRSHSADCRIDVSTRPLAILYFHVPASGPVSPEQQKALCSSIKALTLTWKDKLREAIGNASELSNREVLRQKYAAAFPEEYIASASLEGCIQDIVNLEKISEHTPIAIDIAPSRGSGQLCNLLIYSYGKGITISHALPILENTGFEIISEKSTPVQTQGEAPLFLHSFEARSRNGTPVDFKTFRENVAPGLVDIFLGLADNDALNTLLLDANLSIRSIALLRTYTSFIWQITSFVSKSAIINTIASHPHLASSFWNIFEIMFNPALGGTPESRKKRCHPVLMNFRESLRSVSNINQDRILRVMINVLENTLRTNFYQNSPTIAVKICSENVELMPAPRPAREIFMRNPAFQGVHLRGGLVARGGIRWSDRVDDFRNEILDLVKTQIVKNAVIVPTGAKGGFVLKRPPSNPEELPQVVQGAYREFIRALLSLTDNRVADTIVHPSGLVIYDGPDPYLTVAADKGTATFSDIANKIAVDEFDFWLGDAFASGGSQGYDHKKYGITARGAWECTKRHFSDAGIDYITQPFTAVGIGDMSGDVFGNGLLLSDQYRLIAAFNHKHVFVDPTPDPKTSFVERKRLFSLSRSNWTDYNPKLISPGGGVFGRFDKEITLTAEIRSALQIPDSVADVINGEELIRQIMLAPVDLLWNGGIGTYVKASSESNADVNDGTNDGVRVNANDLRLRVVSEGGNLGFTQKARIEFNQRGGRINTDAVDNSAGVDLSDHEVNYKILFGQLMRAGKLSIEERNSLLSTMAEDVCELCLEHNRGQALLLTLSSERSKKRMDYFKSLVRELARLGYIDRRIDNIPDDEELGKRANRSMGLTKPELATVVSAVKRWLKDILRDSELPKDPVLKTYLNDYFPAAMRDRFHQDIPDHPLAVEISINQIANTCVDIMGPTSLHRLCLAHSVSPVTTMKCFLAADHIVGRSALLKSVKKLDSTNTQLFLELTQQVNKSLYQLTSWLIAYHGRNVPLNRLVEFYQEPYADFLASAPAGLFADYKDSFQSRLELYVEQGIDLDAARNLALLPAILLVFEVLWTAKRSGKDLVIVGNSYGAILHELGITRLLKSDELVEADNQWEAELLINAFGELRRSVSVLCAEFLEKDRVEPDQIREAIGRKRGSDRLKHFVREIRDKVPDPVMVAVIANRLRDCAGRS